MPQKRPVVDSREPAALGNFVRAQRERLGLSQRDLATRIGVTNGYISRIEKGDYQNVSQRILRQLADSLNVEPEDLYAVAGYPLPLNLPGFSAYLRAKYEMSDDAARELTAYFDTFAAEHQIQERPN